MKQALIIFTLALTIALHADADNLIEENTVVGTKAALYYGEYQTPTPLQNPPPRHSGPAPETAIFHQPK